jgi:hypothetical protein
MIVSFPDAANSSNIGRSADEKLIHAGHWKSAKYSRVCVPDPYVGASIITVGDDGVVVVFVDDDGVHALRRTRERKEKRSVDFIKENKKMCHIYDCDMILYNSFLFPNFCIFLPFSIE